MKNNKVIIISSVIIILVIIYTVYKIYTEKNKIVDYSNNLNVYAFNAGKADCFVIRKGSSTIMIDTATSNMSDEIISYLNANDINKIDYLILTHFDKDHVGSAASIINNIEVEKILQSNFPKDSQYYNDYLEALKNKNIAPIMVTNSYSIDIDGVSYYVDGPKKIYDKKSSNNSSLIVEINYKNNNLLFMGDAMNDRINDFIKNNKKSFDFIKIPYHGNYQDSLMELLNNTRPKYAVVTSSNDKKEDKQMIEVLKYKNVKYYLTRKGDVFLSFDGNKVYINQY